MAAPKRTETEREADLVRIAKLHRKGCPERKIARMLGLAPSQIHYDLEEIRARYAKQIIHTREMHVNEINAQLDDLLLEHWKCYQRIKAQRVKVVVERSLRTDKDGEGKPTGEGGMEITREVTTTEQQVPGAEHLRAIHDILKSKRELFGADAPRRVDVRKLTIDFEQLIRESEAAKLTAGSAHSETQIDDELAELIKQIPNLPEADDTRPQNGFRELPPPPSTNGGH